MSVAAGSAWLVVVLMAAMLSVAKGEEHTGAESSALDTASMRRTVPIAAAAGA